MTVGVGMLKSYQHMGVAEVACTEGCSCEPQAFDLHQEEKVSFAWKEKVSSSGRDSHLILYHIGCKCFQCECLENDEECAPSKPDMLRHARVD